MLSVLIKLRWLVPISATLADCAPCNCCTPQITSPTGCSAWGSPSSTTGSARTPTPTSSPTTWSAPDSCTAAPAAAKWVGRHHGANRDVGHCQECRWSVQTCKRCMIPLRDVLCFEEKGRLFWQCRHFEVPLTRPELFSPHWWLEEEAEMPELLNDSLFISSIFQTGWWAVLQMQTVVPPYNSSSTKCCSWEGCFFYVSSNILPFWP